MIQPGQPPTESEVKKWVGRESYKYWKQFENLIEQKYPNIFSPDWLFGGKKHGWVRRYKKSRSFCTFIPERNQFGLRIDHKRLPSLLSRKESAMSIQGSTNISTITARPVFRIWDRAWPLSGISVWHLQPYVFLAGVCHFWTPQHLPKQSALRSPFLISSRCDQRNLPHSHCN